MILHFCSLICITSFLKILPVFYFRHILAAVHFNFNLQKEIKCGESDGTEQWRVSYPIKFKNGEVTVGNVKITPNFGKYQRDTEIYNLG